MPTFLTRSATSQTSSYPIVLARLGGLHSRPSPHLKSGSTGNRTRDLKTNAAVEIVQYYLQFSYPYFYLLLVNTITYCYLHYLAILYAYNNRTLIIAISL